MSIIPELYDDIQAYQKTQAIYVATKLEVASLLHNKKSISVQDMAKTLCVNDNILFRLLSTLETIGIFENIGNKTFRQTEKSKLLSPKTPNSLYDFIIRSGTTSYQAWSSLLDGIKRNSIPFEETFQSHYFDYLEKNKNQETLFNKTMSSHTGHDINHIVKSLDLKANKNVIDIGAGNGTLMHGILQKVNLASGAAFDLEDTISQIDRTNTLQNMMYIAGDFFKSIPLGYDYHILKFILHDWDDPHAMQILTNCRKAINPHGELIIIDALMSDNNNSKSIKWHDLHMFTLFGGKERSKKNMLSIIKESGFENTSVTHLPRSGLLPLSLVRCVAT